MHKHKTPTATTVVNATPHILTLSVTGAAKQQRCVSALPAVCVRTSRLFLPVSAERVTDHPPALALPIDVSLASVGGQLMGFHYQHLSVATMSALPPP